MTVIFIINIPVYSCVFAHVCVFIHVCVFARVCRCVLTCVRVSTSMSKLWHENQQGYMYWLRHQGLKMANSWGRLYPFALWSYWVRGLWVSELMLTLLGQLRPKNPPHFIVNIKNHDNWFHVLNGNWIACFLVSARKPVVANAVPKRAPIAKPAQTRTSPVVAPAPSKTAVKKAAGSTIPVNDDQVNELNGQVCYETFSEPLHA